MEDKKAMGDFMDMIYRVIRSNPSWYGHLVDMAARAWTDYSESVTKKENEILLFASLISKADKRRLLNKINKEMFHPEIIKALSRGLEVKNKK